MGWTSGRSEPDEALDPVRPTDGTRPEPNVNDAAEAARLALAGWGISETPTAAHGPPALEADQLADWAAAAAIAISTAAEATAGPTAGLNCVLPDAPTDAEWLGREQRRLARYPVQASRPIALRLLDRQGDPRGLWHLADILDISRGGLCLMVDTLQDLPIGQGLQLDVRAHPDFRLLRLESQVRWCHSAHGFTTLGVAFLPPLDHLPRLELERRTARRDPNSEPWAQD